MIDHQLFDSKELTIKKLLARDANPRLYASSAICGVLGLAALVAIAFIWLLDLDTLELGFNYRGLERLISGGTVRSLTVEGGQWWRIFTYGLAMNGYGLLLTIFVDLTLGLVFWKLIRFNELISGPWRTIGAFFGAYLLCGFALSVLGGPFIYGGLFVLTPIIVGMIAGTINAHQNQLFSFLRTKLVWPLALFLLLPLFTSSGDWISSGLGFVMGWAMMNLIHFRAHRSTWAITVSGLSLGVIFLLSLIFAFVPLPYGLARDYVVIETLFIQAQHNLALNLEKVNIILGRLNWGTIDSDANLVPTFIPPFINH